MAKANVSLPQGTRDFGADVVRKRNYIFNTIRTVFELYGFEPLETPAMENLETLMGKYGEEGDKLIFKILNNGLDNPAKQQQVKEDFEKVLAGKTTSGITERALKYDLTIPFARYVAMNHNQLTMPFKRYQIQPVWRADRPQKGRYREFYQCDADVVGSTSLLNEVELALIYCTVFTQLGIAGYEIRINSRKIWQGIADFCECPEKITDLTIALDKLDKIGEEGVKKELSAKGFSEEKISKVFECFNIDAFPFNINALEERGKSPDEINKWKSIEISSPKSASILYCLDYNFYKCSDIGLKGINEIIEILYSLNGYKINIDYDVYLARGLNYYTGSIFEIKAPASVKMGSIGGGGRYDDLTGLFGVPNIPGVGISFGVDRIYDVMEELKLFPAGVHTGTTVLFFNLGDAESRKAFELMQQLRSKGTSAELYHEQAKFDKQFKYAEKKQIPFAVIIGVKELETNTCNIKNLQTGQQETISFAALLAKFY